MEEDSKDKSASQAPVPQQNAAAPSQPQPQPRPATAVPPKPVVPPKPPAPAPTPASRPAPPKDTRRRLFIQLLVTVGAVLSIVPFVPWGRFLLSSVSSSGAKKRQAAVLDLNTRTNNNANGGAAGKTVNVNDLTSFPPNGTWLLTYPSSGDITVDSQNPDTFQKYQLIRLPTELGGAQKSAAAFVAFSKVCVHLWCSPNYDPQHSADPRFETYQCPCHGSIYQIPTKDSGGNLIDAGKAIQGPASLQPAPTNAIPMLTLTADSSGNLFIEAPVEDIDHNGVLGYGRNYASYQNYILPAANGKSTS